MAWLAVHPDLTEDVRVPDEEGAPVFTFGFWPPREAAKFDVILQRLKKDADSLDPVKDYDRFCDAAGIDAKVFADMARFGVRGWTAEGSIPAATETVKIDGRDHVALTDASVEVLRVNHLLIAVAVKAALFNRLTEAQKKTSGWQPISRG